MILSRYIFKETIKTQVAVLGILLMIFLSQSFIRILSRAARGALPTQLVTEMLAWGHELGCGEAWLGTEPDNLPARELYRRFNPAEEEGFIYYEFNLRNG